MDLDSSLDDIIKRKQKINRAQQQKTKAQTRRQNQQQQKRQVQSSRQSNNRGTAANRPRGQVDNRLAVNPQSRTIGKSILQRTNLGSRTTGVNKPKSISTATLKNRTQQQQQQQQQLADPSKIVITKALRSGGRSDYGDRGRYDPAPVDRYAQPSATPSQYQQSSFSIRGLASAGNGGGMSIRGESGPATVVISNLDPAANAEDVRTACLQFGPVVRCELMTDRIGRSYGEAEVEFATKAAALDCIAKLDNEVADGRILRAILRSRPSPAPASVPAPSNTYASTTLRSVIAPTGSGYTTSSVSGKLYSDQMVSPSPPQPNIPPRQYPSYRRRY